MIIHSPQPGRCGTLGGGDKLTVSLQRGRSVPSIRGEDA